MVPTLPPAPDMFSTKKILAGPGAELLRNQPRHQIGRAAGRKADDDLDRTIRPGGRGGGIGRRARETRCKEEKRQSQIFSHFT
jgi:hypothetical protein